MKLTFTFSNGKEFEVKDVKIGDTTQVKYIDKDGKEVIRFIVLNHNLKLVMN